MASPQKNQPSHSTNPVNKPAGKQKKIIDVREFFSDFIDLIYKVLKILILSIVIIFSIILIVFIVFAIFPSTHNFEGNIIAHEMSFAYKGKQPKTIIEDIREIRQLENEGEQQNISFSGKFQSQALPELEQLKSFNIKLPNSSSKWIVSPVDTKSESEIALKKLRIQPDTKLTDLTYDFHKNRLYFILKNNANSSNTLKLSLGIKPIRVTLQGYKISDCKSPNCINESQPLDFIVTPDNSEQTINITNDTKFYISLTKPPKLDTVQWFRPDISTKDVNFIHTSKESNLNDDVQTSTIVEGKIRMVEQEREIKPNQFLMGEDNKPLDIQLIRHLQINPKKGIEARFSGRAKEIKIGLDPNFSVSKIQGSWLDGILPRDVIIAIIASVVGAGASILVPWLSSNSSKHQGKP